MAEANSSAEVEIKCVQKDIKKVKKKLKEIENLQKLDRNLNIDEKDKVSTALFYCINEFCHF